MARGRRPEDWERDLAAARSAEAELAAILAQDARLVDLQNHTEDYERLDFSFSYMGHEVQLDLKEKIRPTSTGLASLWPEVSPTDLFVLDETVYRRVVWQGGGGYLIVHDHPQTRWLLFGPWELTLGPRLRYLRWGERRRGAFPKGKIMLDLRGAAHSSPEFSVDDLLSVIERSHRQLTAVQPVEIAGQALPEIGSAGGGR